MAEKDLLDILRDPPPRMAGAEFLGRLKTAGAADVLRGWYGVAKSNKAAIGGAALGAALFASAAYKANKPDETGLSPEQKLTRAGVDAVAKKDAERTTPPGIHEELAGVGARTSKEMADVFSKRPGAAAASAGVIGAGLGAKFVPKLIKLVKR
jgi:hypothetical protein